MEECSFSDGVSANVVSFKEYKVNMLSLSFPNQKPAKQSNAIFFTEEKYGFEI